MNNHKVSDFPHTPMPWLSSFVLTLCRPGDAIEIVDILDGDILGDRPFTMEIIVRAGIAQIGVRDDIGPVDARVLAVPGVPD